MGKLKRKGCFEYKLGWHQNHSALVVPKVAEKVLVEGAPIRQTVEEWPDLMDFMLRAKVPRSSKLQWGPMPEPPAEGEPLLPPTVGIIQNTTRYIVARDGWSLRKWMPPLKGKENWRPIGIESGWMTMVCNRLDDDTKADLMDNINHDYYIQEVEKLVMGLK